MMDAAARLTAIEDLIRRSVTLGQALYALSERRWQLTLAFRRVIRTLFDATEEKFGRNSRDGRARGVGRLTVAWLGAHGARYALIDTRGSRAGTENGARLSIRTLRVDAVDSDRLVVDEVTGAVVGRVCEASRNWNTRDETGHPVAAWTDPAFRAPGMNHDEALLPLAGPALSHACFRGQAALAERILSGGSPEIEGMRAIDREVATLVDERDGLAARALAIATEGLDVDTVEARHAELISAIKSHDWWWNQADQPKWAMRDREDDLIAALGAIPEVEAILLWHRHVPSPMSMHTWSSARARIDRLPRRALPLAA